MSALSLRLPESLHQAARELAAREGISVNQLVTTALAEKLAAITTVEYLQRAQRGNRKKFLAAMARVPNVAPPPWDQLPHEAASPRRRPAPTRARRADPRRNARP